MRFDDGGDMDASRVGYVGQYSGSDLIDEADGGGDVCCV